MRRDRRRGRERGCRDPEVPTSAGGPLLRLRDVSSVAELPTQLIRRRRDPHAAPSLQWSASPAPARAKTSECRRPEETSGPWHLHLLDVTGAGDRETGERVDGFENIN